MTIPSRRFVVVRPTVAGRLRLAVLPYHLCANVKRHSEISAASFVVAQCGCGIRRKGKAWHPHPQKSLPASALRCLANSLKKVKGMYPARKGPLGAGAAAGAESPSKIYSDWRLRWDQRQRGGDDDKKRSHCNARSSSVPSSSCIERSRCVGETSPYGATLFGAVPGSLQVNSANSLLGLHGRDKDLRSAARL
jgi:hypothetical protein